MEEFNKKILSENLLLLRTRSNYSRADVAYICETNEARVSRAESGLSEIQSTFLAKILNLNCSL